MMHATNDELRDALARLARWVWNRTTEAHRLGMSFSEETITEMLLLKLARKFSHRGLSIRSFSKYEEGTSYRGGPPTGADWEFWISDRYGRGIRLRVQAKRLFLRSGSYESLDISKPQHKNLIINAGNATPIYVFYNGQCYSPRRGWPFHMERCCFCLSPFSFWERAWGVGFDLAKNLSHTKAKPAPRDIPRMLPWHCLLCPCAGTAHQSLPQAVAAALEMLGGKTVELLTKQPEWISVFSSKVSERPTEITLPEGVSHVVHIQDTRDFGGEGRPE